MIEGLRTCPSHSPVSVQAQAFGSRHECGISSNLHPPPAPLLSSTLWPLLSSRPADLSPFLVPGFRPRHILHKLPTPPLIASHTFGSFVYFPRIYNLIYRCLLTVRLIESRGPCIVDRAWAQTNTVHKSRRLFLVDGRRKVAGFS